VSDQEKPDPTFPPGYFLAMMLEEEWLQRQMHNNASALRMRWRLRDLLEGVRPAIPIFDLAARPAWLPESVPQVTYSFTYSTEAAKYVEKPRYGFWYLSPLGQARRALLQVLAQRIEQQKGAPGE